MKRIDGQPVANGHRRLRIKVSAADIKDGAPMNPNACAIARACLRQVPRVVDAMVHKKRLFLLFEGQTRWQRWYVPEYATRELFNRRRSRYSPAIASQGARRRLVRNDAAG